MHLVSVKPIVALRHCFLQDRKKNKTEKFLITQPVHILRPHPVSLHREELSTLPPFILR